MMFEENDGGGRAREGREERREIPFCTTVLSNTITWHAYLLIYLSICVPRRCEHSFPSFIFFFSNQMILPLTNTTTTGFYRIGLFMILLEEPN